MGLFDNIFRPKETKEQIKNATTLFRELVGYRPVFKDWHGEIYESALVRASIDARARHISKLNVLMTGTAKQDLANRFRFRPNKYMTWSQFLYRVSTILDVQNTCFLVPTLDKDLKVTGYFPALPESCEVVTVEGQEEPWLRYRFRNGSIGAIEMRKCVVLTKFQYRDDFFGTRNDALDETMDLISIQGQGIKEAVKNSATYRFYASASNFTKDTDLRKNAERFNEENFSSEAKGGGVLLFPNIYENIHQIQQTAYTVDAEQMRLIQTNVFDYFGVNEGILQNKATGDDLDAFYNGAIEPFQIQLADGLTSAIYTDTELGFGSKVLVTSNRLMYMTTTAKISMAQQLGDRGAMTIDEIRELFNYPPLPDGLGNRSPIRGEYYFVQEEGDTNGN